MIKQRPQAYGFKELLDIDAQQEKLNLQVMQGVAVTTLGSVLALVLMIIV